MQNTSLITKSSAFSVQTVLVANSLEQAEEALQAPVVETSNKVAAASTPAVIDNLSYIPKGKKAKVFVVYSQPQPPTVAANIAAEEKGPGKRALQEQENDEPEAPKQKRINASPEPSHLPSPNNAQQTFPEISASSLKQDAIPKHFSAKFPLLINRRITIILNISDETLKQLFLEKKVVVTRKDITGTSEIFSPHSLTHESSPNKPNHSHLLLTINKNTASGGNYLYSVTVNNVPVAKDMFILRDLKRLYSLFIRGTEGMREGNRFKRERTNFIEQISWWRDFNSYRKTVIPKVINGILFLTQKDNTTDTQQAALSVNNVNSGNDAAFLQEILKKLENVDNTIDALYGRVAIIENTISNIHQQMDQF